ncbi:MAG: ceramidase domain-containing protein [Rhizobium sp.]|nr:ceramidase domain-containing protein [Rhizobium sp.]
MTSDWTAPIAGAYCERTAPGFWGEPLNAGSSLLVIIVSLVALVYVLRTRSLSPGLIALMALALAIGIGSFLWHTFANRWAELADVLPIWAFVALYGAAVLKNSLNTAIGLPVAALFGAFVFFAGLALSMRETHMLGDTVSGSTQYLPALFVVFATGRMVWKERQPSFRLIVVAIALFALSFAFRSLDMPLCSAVPFGTHFLWHVTNCLAFGVLLAALIRFPPGNGKAADK